MREKNIWKIHREVAIEFCKKLLSDPKVVGIIFLGSIGRKYGDEMSDIDIGIFVRRGFDPKKYGLKWGGKIKFNRFNIDYFFKDFDEFAKEDLDLEGKWAYKFSEIYYDPTGKIKKIIKEKIRLSKEDWKYLEMEGIVQAFYYCVSVPKKLIIRKDLESAYLSIFFGIKYLFQALYAYNRELPAADPWYYFWVNKIQKPVNARELKKEIARIVLISELNKENVLKCIQKLENVIKELIPVFEKHLGTSFKEMEEIV